MGKTAIPEVPVGCIEGMFGERVGSSQVLKMWVRSSRVLIEGKYDYI